MELSDVNVMVAGQGGDGSLTVISLLGNALARRGFHLYSTRNVPSRIRGGHAAALVRGSLEPRTGMNDHIDVLIALDTEAVEMAGERVGSNGFVIFDSSAGSLPAGALPDGVTVVEIPFGRLAVRDLRRELFKNSVAFGAVSRILSLGDEEAVSVLEARYATRPALLDQNLQALREGFAFAQDAGFGEDAGPLRLARAATSDRILITGNEAAAIGFLAAGVRFFAGYPITPATEVLEMMNRHIASFGGVSIQAEDELGAVNMALGASLTGVRSLVATSGPGIALMLEGIGHAGAAEIPLVIIDAQRSGPSTGMPTKSEQSDIGMLIHGGNGDFPRIVLAPGNPSDAFELAVEATNLAQRIQGPVYLMLDQSVSQDSATTTPFDLSRVAIDDGARLTQEQLDTLDEYRRYAITPTGLSPLSVPGMAGGMNLVTGNEHDEWGKVSTNASNRVAMMDKRARKVTEITHTLPKGHRFGDPNARVGIIGIGMESGVIREAVERLSAAGIHLAGLQPRTIWPVPTDTLEFIASKNHVYVVEHNQEAQLVQVLASVGAPIDRLTSINRYDGVAFTPREIVDRIAPQETP